MPGESPTELRITDPEEISGAYVPGPPADIRDVFARSSNVCLLEPGEYLRFELDGQLFAYAVLAGHMVICSKQYKGLEANYVLGTSCAGDVLTSGRSVSGARLIVKARASDHCELLRIPVELLGAIGGSVPQINRNIRKYSVFAQIVSRTASSRKQREMQEWLRVPLFIGLLTFLTFLAGAAQ